MLAQRATEAANVGELGAVERAAGIDGSALVARPRLSRTVEILEREADRVRELVAARAGGIRAVDLQPCLLYTSPSPRD